MNYPPCRLLFDFIKLDTDINSKTLNEVNGGGGGVLPQSIYGVGVYMLKLTSDKQTSKKSY